MTLGLAKTPKRGRPDAQAPQELHPDREGRHPPTPPHRQGGRLRSLRPASAPAHHLLRLAAAVLRERRRCLRAQGQARRGRAPADHRRPPRQAPPQGRGRLRADGGARPAKKRAWGALNGAWVPHDTRDQVVDYVGRWSERTEIPAKQLVAWLGIAEGKFYEWRKRYGKANEHNGKVPRDWWLEGWEKRAILDFHAAYPLEGYRRPALLTVDAP